MHITEEMHYQIQRIMQHEKLDYDEATEFLQEIIADHEISIDLDDYEGF